MGKSSKIFILFLIIVSIIFIYSGCVARQQISDRAVDYQIYLSIKDAIENKIEVEEALEDLEYIEKKYPKTYVLSLDKTSIYLNLGDYKGAEKSMEEAFELDPSLDRNVNLLLLYGEIAYENGHIEKSKEMLDKIMSKDEIPEEYKDGVDALIKKVQ